MRTNKTHLRWGIENRGNYEILDESPPDMDEEEWFFGGGQQYMSIIFRGEKFPYGSFGFEETVDNIIKKYPDSISEEKDVDMVEFSKQYINLILRFLSDEGKIIKRKTIYDMTNIVIGKETVDRDSMISDETLLKIYGDDIISRKVYAFVRDNQGLFNE